MKHLIISSIVKISVRGNPALGLKPETPFRRWAANYLREKFSRPEKLIGWAAICLVDEKAGVLIPKFDEQLFELFKTHPGWVKTLSEFIGEAILEEIQERFSWTEKEARNAVAIIVATAIDAVEGEWQDALLDICYGIRDFVLEHKLPALYEREELLGSWTLQ